MRYVGVAIHQQVHDVEKIHKYINCQLWIFLGLIGFNCLYFMFSLIKLPKHTPIPSLEEGMPLFSCFNFSPITLMDKSCTSC